MAGFTFRLQAVLDWRVDKDEAAQRMLGAARQALQDAETALTAAGERLAGARAKTRDAAQAGCDGATSAWHWNWIAGCEDAVRTAERGVQERQQSVAAASLAAQAARRDVRTLERLRERALEKHRYQQKRLEQQALDALGASRFVRREMEGEP